MEETKNVVKSDITDKNGKTIGYKTIDSEGSVTVLDRNKDDIGFIYGDIEVDSNVITCRFKALDNFTHGRLNIGRFLDENKQHSEFMMDDIYCNMRYVYQKDVTPEPTLPSGHKKIVPLSNKKAMGLNGSFIMDCTISGMYFNSITFDIKHESDNEYTIATHIKTSSKNQDGEFIELGTTTGKVKKIKVNGDDYGKVQLRFFVVFTKVSIDDNEAVYVPVPIILTDIHDIDECDIYEDIEMYFSYYCRGAIEPNWCTLNGVGGELLVTKIKSVRVQYNTIKI